MVFYNKEAKKSMVAFFRFFSNDLQLDRFNTALDYFLSMKANNTQHSYKRVAQHWFEFCKRNNLVWTTATAEAVTKWLATLHEGRGQRSRVDGDERIADSTVAYKLTILKNFYEHAIAAGLTDRNPTKEQVKRFRKVATATKRPTQALSREEVKRLFGVCGNDLDGLRDRAFLALLFGGGLRLSECLNLKIGDVTVTNGSLTAESRVTLWHTKSKEPQVQALAPFAVDYVKDYMNARRELGATDGDWLLVQLTKSVGGWKVLNKKWFERTAYNRFKALAKEVGLPSTYTPHSGRATAITRLLELGVDVGEVQTFSRHATLDMVLTYDRRTTKTMSEIAKKLTL